jgi:DNA-directed RNA polymerase specialized sigma24 family protein
MHEAFEALPPRWKKVLWHLDIRGLPPWEAAPLLGLSSNTTVALHRRAKKGLRLSYRRHELALSPLTPAPVSSATRKNADPKTLPNARPAS